MSAAYTASIAAGIPFWSLCPASARWLKSAPSSHSFNRGWEAGKSVYHTKRYTPANIVVL